MSHLWVCVDFAPIVVRPPIRLIDTVRVCL